ncbi:MAG: hypothetical protein JST55_09685 [Bacteroidetes bacterium]|nr:hypothetical protein [Bacteroidota bacterium]
MKDENTNNNEWNSESEWNRISQNAGQYNRSSFFGGERIRVTFSQKMEDNSNQEKPDDNNTDERKQNKPEEENPDIAQKPEKGDGGEQKKDKPEIRYDIN